MAFWSRRKTVAPDDTRPYLNPEMQGLLNEAVANVTRRLSEADDFHRPVQVKDPYDDVRGKAPERRTLPTGDNSADNVLKSSYLTSNSEGRARKISLYQAWLGESFLSGAIEAIAARMISGGWLLRPTDPHHPDENSKAPLQELLDNCNPYEDFHQVIHSQVTDIGWAGECYLEVTWKYHPLMKREIPYEIYTVDPISMDYVLSTDNKSIVGYVQTTEVGSPIQLSTKDIIRIWMPDPRNKFRALSTVEKLLNPVTLDTYLQISEQKYFQQGNRGDVAITLKSAGNEAAGRFTKWVEERFLGVKNAHRPLIVYGDGDDIDVKQIGNRSDLDVIERRKFAGTEMMAAYKVPPHLMSQLEGTGQGGQAVGDTMEKQFVHTAVDPMRQRVMGQYSFALAVQGFGIDDWVIDTAYADMRDSSEIIDIANKKIQAGLSTINVERASMKQKTLGPAGDVPFIVVGSQLIPIAHLPELAKNPPAAVAQQQQQAQQGQMQQQGQEHEQDMAQKQHDLATTQADRAHSLARAKMAQDMHVHKTNTQLALHKTSADLQKTRTAVSARAGASAQQRGPAESVDIGPLFTESVHSYGCVMAPLSPELTDEVFAAQEWIEPDDLAEDGLEDNPHVTIRYGLIETGAHELAILGALGQAEPPFAITLGAPGIFHGKDADVLYLSVDCPALARLHTLIGSLISCAPSDYGVYTPHVTLAYLKKGTAGKYLSVCDITGAAGLSGAMTLADRDERITEIPLTGHLVALAGSVL